LQGFVARPQDGTGRQADGDKQMRINVSDPGPVELFVLDELKCLNICDNARLRQLLTLAV
jgi:hypothetical protein